MSINLYTEDLGSVGGIELYEAVVALLRLSDSPAERLSEGWTLDFKEQWSDEMLKQLRPAAPIRSGTSRKMKYPKSKVCFSVFAMLSFSLAQGQRQCEWNPAWEEFGTISQEANKSLDQFESQVEGKLRERGYSFNSDTWGFAEQKEPILPGARLVRLEHYGGTDATVVYLLLQPESGAVAVFPVIEGMISEPTRATDRIQIEQFNAVVKASKTKLSGESIALLYVRLTRPLEEGRKTCVESMMRTGRSTESVHLRTDFPNGFWWQWTVVVNPVHGIKKVSCKRHR